MLLLTFGVSGCRYALEVQRVVEVVPRIPLRPIPHAPGYVAGLFNHGGAVVPVLDLGCLLDGAACAARLSTRIIVVNYPLPDRRVVLLGVIAEQVTELREAREDQVRSQPVPPAHAPYLGPILQFGEEMIQLIVIEQLMPDTLRDALYGGMLGLPS